MDNKKLAKLIDLIVKKRLSETLKSKTFKTIVENIVTKEINKRILLESNNNKNVKNKNYNDYSVSGLLNDMSDVEENIRTELNDKIFSKNPELNKILKQTAHNKISSPRDTYINMAALQNETYAFAKSGLGGFGGNVKDEVVPISENTIINTPQSPHDISGLDPEDSVDLSQVDTSVVHNNNLASIFNKDYSKILDKSIEKSKERKLSGTTFPVIGS